MKRHHTIEIALLAIATGLPALSPCTKAGTSFGIQTFQLGEVLVVGGESETTAGVLRHVDAVRIDQRERKDVADAAALLPEVFVGRSGMRNEKMLYVRGFDMRQVPLFVDGIPVYIPFEGTVDPGRFGAFDIAQVSVARGYSPAVYGPNTLGGAINVISLRPMQPFELLARAGVFSGKGYEGGVRTAMMNAGGYLQGGVFYRTRDHYRLSGDYSPAAAEDGGRRENSFSRDLQLSVKGALTPGNGNEFAVGFIRQDSEKGVPPYGGTDPRIQPRYWRYTEWLKNSLYFVGHMSLGLNSYLKPRVYYDKYQNTLDSFDDETYTTRTRPYAFRSFYDNYTFGSSVEAGGEFGERHIPRTAAHYKRDLHRENNEGRPQSEFSDETWSLAVEDGIQLASGWKLVLGVAYERRENVTAVDRSGAQPVEYPDNANHIVNPQGGLFYHMTTGVFRVTVAHKSRFPTLKDRYSFRRGMAIPNPDLEPEKAIHYEAGYSGHIGPNIEGHLSVFYSKLDDVIQQVDNVQYDGASGTWLYQYRNAGRAEHRGMETGFTYHFGAGMKAGFDYALLERENTSHPELMPTDTPKHRTLSYVELRPISRLTLIPNVEYNSSRYSSSDGTQVDAYWLWNLNAKMEFRSGFAVSAGVQNLFDKNYELTEGYPEEGRNYYANVSYRF